MAIVYRGYIYTCIFIYFTREVEQYFFIFSRNFLRFSRFCFFFSFSFRNKLINNNDNGEKEGTDTCRHPAKHCTVRADTNRVRIVSHHIIPSCTTAGEVQNVFLCLNNNIAVDTYMVL